MNKEYFDFYNIYNFKIAVFGPVRSSFEKEFSFFKTKSSKENPDLIIKPTERILPINVLRGAKESIGIPFEENNNEFLYTFNAPHEPIINYSESLMMWQDKTFIHASAVSKNNKSYIFTGESGIGKTNTVLNLIKNGFDYISDDWLIIGNNKAYPFPKTIHIFCYNLADKEIANAVLGHKVFFYKFICSLLTFVYKISPNRFLNILIDKYRPRFDRPFINIFPKANIGNPCYVEKIFFIEKKDIKKIEIKDNLNPQELATRMSYYNFYEKGSPLFREYSRYVQKSGFCNKKLDNRLKHDYNIMYGTFKNIKLKRVLLPIKINLLEEDLEKLFEL